MKPISAKRAFEMGIPGLPLANRGDSGGQGPEDAAISNRFFGGEDRDDHNSNAQPIVYKTHERHEECQSNDVAADEYFKYLYQKVMKRRLSKNKTTMIYEKRAPPL